MFRKTGLLVTIIAVAVILMAAVTVLAQSGATPLTTDNGSAIAPTATPSSESSSTSQTAENDNPDTDAAQMTPESTPTPPTEGSAPVPTSTPETSAQSVEDTVARLTPYTPRVPQGPETPQQQTEAPLRLVIPAIGVDATVEWVGVDELGNMDVPSTYRTVAWYEPGPRPGMTGNAVIAGHLDSATGPAVFYRLSDLQPGDEVVVIAHGGQELHFAVTGIERFNSETAPLHDIFGPASGRHLNLITCEGAFDTAAGQYDERLVVYTTLITG